MTAPMGWHCDVCGAPFEHGRVLVEHLLAEHPEISTLPCSDECGCVHP